MQQQEIQINNSWEELISKGIEAKERHDGSQWDIGDIAAEVEVEYGENSLGKFAYAINMRKKSVLNYRTVARKFPKHLRKTYSKLSFSHFAALTAVEKPEAWLIKADDEDWSVETLQNELKKAFKDDSKMEEKPPQVYRCEVCGLWRLKNVSNFDICRGHYQIGKNGLVYK